MLEPEHIDAALKPMNPNEIVFRFIVKPGSKKEGLAGVDASGQLILRVSALAVEGRANERIIELLSEILHCPKRNLELAKGQTSRHKEVRIKHMSIDEIKERFRQS